MIVKATKEMLDKVQQMANQPMSEPKGKKRVSKVQIAPEDHVKLDIDSEAVRDFVENAPDGPRSIQRKAKKPKVEKRTADGRWQLKGKKVIITVGLAPDMLEAFDRRAKEQAMSRSQLMELMMRKELLKPSQAVGFK